MFYFILYIEEVYDTIMDIHTVLFKELARSIENDDGIITDVSYGKISQCRIYKFYILLFTDHSN